MVLGLRHALIEPFYALSVKPLFTCGGQGLPIWVQHRAIQYGVCSGDRFRA